MMTHLILMRHGKAEKDSASGEDYERNLAARGVEETTLVAQALKARGVKPTFALVSAAHRTHQTFDALQAVLGPIAADVREDLFNADSQALRTLIETHEETTDCLLVIGHNPGIQYLVMDYMTQGAAAAPDYDRVRGGYPTAAATVFDVDAAGRPIYDGLLRPKDLLSAGSE